MNDRKAGDDHRKVVIFGNMLSASLAWYCLKHDSPFEVAAFTVDAAYLDSDSFEGLPIVPFETVMDDYPPNDFRMLIPVGYHQANGLRRSRYEAAMAMGYDFVSYVSSRASIWPDLHIGKNVLIYEHAIIQPFAKIGDNTIIRSGSHISHHCEIGDHCFIAPQIAMGGECRVEEQSFLGVGCVVRDRITIGKRGFIGAGSVVTRNTEPDGAYIGNPARKLEKTSLEVSGG